MRIRFLLVPLLALLAVLAGGGAASAQTTSTGCDTVPYPKECGTVGGVEVVRGGSGSGTGGSGNAGSGSGAGGAGAGGGAARQGGLLSRTGAAYTIPAGITGLALIGVGSLAVLAARRKRTAA